MKFLPIAIALLLGGLAACKRNNNPLPASETSATASGNALPADFEPFYQQFHRDSLYQVAHIAWPLQGDRSVQVDSSTYQKQAHQWQPENWVMHRPVDYASGDYRREIRMLGDIVVTEFILIKAGGYGIERRFAKRPDGEWEMIFYSDMQERGAE
jgi:hypothetical protein